MERNNERGEGFWLKKARAGKLTGKEKLKLAQTVKALYDAGYLADPDELSEIFGFKMKRANSVE